MADARVLARLRQAALRQGRSLGDVIREALDEKAASLAPAPSSLAHGDSHGGGPKAAEIGDAAIQPDSWRSS